METKGIKTKGFEMEGLRRKDIKRKGMLKAYCLDRFLTPFLVMKIS
jgi:hypothetical protein